MYEMFMSDSTMSFVFDTSALIVMGFFARRFLVVCLLLCAELFFFVSLFPNDIVYIPKSRFYTKEIVKEASRCWHDCHVIINLTFFLFRLRYFILG